jgi:hypothetical protein
MQRAIRRISTDKMVVSFNQIELPTKDTAMRLYVLSALAVTTFVAMTAFHPTPANAVVYCSAAGVPQGCVARRGIAPRANVITTTGLGVRRGTAFNRGGPVNRRGRR